MPQDNDRFHPRESDHSPPPPLPSREDRHIIERREESSHEKLEKSLPPTNQAPDPWPQPWDSDSDE